MLHVNYTIDEKALDRYAARFTVHRAKDEEALGPPIELEQAFPYRLKALQAVLAAMQAHMAERYGLGEDESTIEER